jgi:hypothetical protein
MPRLVAFGDSYTFGDALPDCWPVTVETAASNYAWPKLLSDKLGYDCVNLAKGGNSNLEILWKMMNTNFLNDDLILIAWTPHVFRSIFTEFKTSGELSRIDPFDDRYKTLVLLSNPTPYYSFTTGYDRYIKDYLIMQHGGLYLKNKNVKFYNIDIHAHNTIPIEIDNLLSIQMNCPDLGLDKKHPGVKSQQIFSNKMYDMIGKHELR